MNLSKSGQAATVELDAVVETEAPIFGPALRLFILLSVITGIAYPLALTGLAQLLMPDKANGSLVTRGDQVVGTELVGQAFSGENYFWSRPSATGPTAYNAAASSGSNLGPSNPALHSAVAKRVANLRAANPAQVDASGAALPVPVDLVTASASGLDPHISIAGANYQIARVARSRGLSESQVQALVAQHSESAQLGFLGEPRVHVLRLNLALDELVSVNP